MQNSPIWTYTMKNTAIFTALCFCLFAPAVARANQASDGATRSDFGFGRPINPAWFPDDPRQWRRFSESQFITDLRGVMESNALTFERREKGRWKVLPYSTETQSGFALSCYAKTDPMPVTLRLGREGRFAVYVCLSSVSGGITRAQQSGIMAKLGTQTTYRRFQNNMALTSTRQDVAQEQFIAAGYLGADEVINIRPLPNFAATVLYVRLVPLDADELAAWEKQGNDASYRTAVGTWDGHSWIWPYRPQSEADLRSSFHDMDKT